MYHVCPSNRLFDDDQIDRCELKSVRVDKVVEKRHFELLKHKLIGCRVAGGKDLHFVSMLAQDRCKALRGD